MNTCDCVLKAEQKVKQLESELLAARKVMVNETARHLQTEAEAIKYSGYSGANGKASDTMGLGLFDKTFRKFAGETLLGTVPQGTTLTHDMVSRMVNAAMGDFAEQSKYGPRIPTVELVRRRAIPEPEPSPVEVKITIPGDRRKALELAAKHNHRTVEGQVTHILERYLRGVHANGLK